MESFHWDEHFVTGLEKVDEQHYQLVIVINQFGNLLLQPEGFSFDAYETIFSELASYAKYHFREEEILMDQAGIDTRHSEYHQNEHVDFLDEVTQLYSGISAETPDKAKQLLKFLISWLAYHILGTDQSMAKQVFSIRSGQTANEAYLSEEKMKEGAVEPLLDALSGLFQQVSERNRELFLLNKMLEYRIEERTRELAHANSQLQAIALTDVLTGLPNRRYAMQRLAQEWEASEKENTSLACMMIDADGFKQINDNYGHDAGDEVLRKLSKELSHTVRTDDVVCRLGGDEFMVICPKTSQSNAMLVAEKLRQYISFLCVPSGNGEWHGSISVGVAERCAEMSTFEELIKAADDGVYIAKRNGRNCVASKT